MFLVFTVRISGCVADGRVGTRVSVVLRIVLIVGFGITGIA